MQIIRATVKDIKNIAPLFDEYRVFYGKTSDIQSAVYFLGDRVSRDESIIFAAKNDEGVYCGFTQLYPIFSSTRMNRL